MQGIAWDAAKRMYASESDQKTGELNVIQKGKNYGWPTVDGDGTDAKFTNPLVSWPIADSSCSGRGGAGAHDRHRLPAGPAALAGRAPPATAPSSGQPRALLAGEYGRLRGLVAAPDGSLWVTTSNQERGGEPGAGRRPDHPAGLLRRRRRAELTA